MRASPGILLRCLFSIVAASVFHVDASAQRVDESMCGPIKLQGQFGPFDYRTAPTEVVSMVEGVHFTRDVELLRHGATASIGGDLDYTLRALPNNYRALASLTRLYFRDKQPKVSGMRWMVECYFERAIRFVPDDPMVRQAYGFYLVKLGRKKEAKVQVDAASDLAGDGANLNYNLGLLYFDLGEYQKSLDHAWAAYRRGYELQGLKNKLKAAGKWSDPP